MPIVSIRLTDLEMIEIRERRDARKLHSSQQVVRDALGFPVGDGRNVNTPETIAQGFASWDDCVRHIVTLDSRFDALLEALKQMCKLVQGHPKFRIVREAQQAAAAAGRPGDLDVEWAAGFQIIEGRLEASAERIIHGGTGNISDETRQRLEHEAEMNTPSEGFVA